ncbi:MAG: hypothetical protein ACK2UC_14495 [Anaerolineae bacterium]|jgi:multidrug efflux pump subunit AcrA (membrane-fusion protein)
MIRRVAHLWLLAVVGLLLASCGGTLPATNPEDTLPVSEPAVQSPILSPLSPLSPLTAPTAAPAEVPPSMELVVLHTNDNWGATEPCG